MIFNSLTYLVFLLVIVSFYWILPRRPRQLLIFASSLTFYAFWRVEFLPVMLFSVVVDYSVALRMQSVHSRRKKQLLFISLFANLGLLLYFKYLIFFSDNAVGLINLLGGSLDPIALKIILPLGISFYTFQTISYTVDVYRGFIKPEKDFITYGCYVTFFPQLVAGPILRASEVIYQFKDRPSFNYEFISIGFRRILYGLFLKVVLADNIAPLVDYGFSVSVSSLSAVDVWTLGFLFGFQIYFDFSAYSHIALGSAKMIGINFPENFNFPYMANSPRDFWKRWHISLSSWIRDYLYLPLIGEEVRHKSTGGLGVAVESSRKNKALFLSWFIMGLWHGANWTFALWGIYHATVIFLYRNIRKYFKNFSPGFKNLLGTLVTLPIMMLGWIPFRAENIRDTLIMWSKIFQPHEYISMGFRENMYIIAFILLLGMAFTYYMKGSLEALKNKTSRLLFISDFSFIFVLIILVSVFLRPVYQFIYFQF